MKISHGFHDNTVSKEMQFLGKKGEMEDYPNEAGEEMKVPFPLRQEKRENNPVLEMC